MAENLMTKDVSPRLRAQAMGLLSEMFAVQVGTSPETVEDGHAVSGYLSDDPILRHRFTTLLERRFGVPIDGARFDRVATVGELADLLAIKLQERKAASGAGRAYVVCYRDASGRLAESRVRAKNHQAAIESLRAEGLQEVVSVERDEEDGDDPRAGKVHNIWTGCIFPLLAAFAVAGGAVAYYWWRRG